MSLLRSFALTCAGVWAAAASEPTVLEKERAATTAEVYPKNPAADRDACGSLGGLDGGFEKLATMFCDPDNMFQRALRKTSYSSGLNAARALEGKLTQAAGQAFSGGVALTKRTKEPIGAFAEAVAASWGLIGETSFLIALRGGPHPAVAIVGPGRPPTAAPGPGAAQLGGWRASAERLATRFLSQGRPGEAAAAALDAIAAAYGGAGDGAATPAAALVDVEAADDEAHGLEVEVFSCGHDNLNSTTTAKDLLREMARIASLKALDEVTYQFEPQGVTSLLMVEESHLSIHTWPEFGYAALDVVSGTGIPRGSIDELLSVSKTMLQCGDVAGKLTTRRHPLSRKAAQKAARAAAAGKREEL